MSATMPSPVRPIRTMIFDFDGTIADTMQVLVEIYNNILVPRFKCKPIAANEEILLRSSRPHEIMISKGVTLLNLPFIVLTARKELSRHMDHVKPHGAIISTLIQLSRQGMRLGICSSNSRSNVCSFLATYKILHLFDFIHTGKNVFGKHRTLRHIISQHKLRKEETVYIGDEIRDVEAAHTVGIRAISVLWGFNNADALRNTKPDILISSPEELTKVTHDTAPVPF